MTRPLKRTQEASSAQPAKGRGELSASSGDKTRNATATSPISFNISQQILIIAFVVAAAQVSLNKVEGFSAQQHLLHSLHKLAVFLAQPHLSRNNQVAFLVALRQLARKHRSLAVYLA
jgi:hypothetical protein